MNKKNIITILIISMFLTTSLTTANSVYTIDKTNDEQTIVNEDTIKYISSESIFSLNFKTNSDLTLGKDISLILQVSSQHYVPNARIDFVIPSSMILSEGELQWKGEITEDSTIKIPLKIKLNQEKDYAIYAKITDEDKVFKEEQTAYYFSALNGVIDASENPISLYSTVDNDNGEIISEFEDVQIIKNEKSTNNKDGHTLSGNFRVKDEYETGYFYPKYVRIELFQEGYSDCVARYRTDDQGNFKFTGLPDGKFKIIIYSENSNLDPEYNICEVTDRIYPSPIWSVYAWISPDWYDIDSDTEIQGTIGTNTRGSLKILNNIVDTYIWLKNKVNWNRDRAAVNWPRDESQFRMINIAGFKFDFIEIEGGHEWLDNVHIHEYSHAIMYKAYGDNLPEGEVIKPHYVYTVSNPGAALSEGWAEFLPCAVKNNCNFGGHDFEYGYYADYVTSGDWDGHLVEGAVAGVLWDLFDGTFVMDYPTWSNYKYGDYVSGEFSKIWTIIENDNPNDILEFWDCWVNRYGFESKTWILFYHQRIIDVTQNFPPYTPSISGPTSGIKNKENIFSAIGDDPHGDKIQFKVDWGDGTVSDWSILQPGNVPRPFSHTYTKTGDFTIKIYSRDMHGLESLTYGTHTIIIEEPLNNPPSTPSLTGPTKVKRGKSYSYTVSATDPDGDDLYYKIYWGDYSATDWIGPFSSGEAYTASHSWSNTGDYTIEAIARDIHWAFSEYKKLYITVVLFTDDEPPTGPTANAGGPYTGTMGNPISFDFSQSSPGPGNSINKMRIDWDGDGNWDTGTILTNYWVDWNPNPSYTYNTMGTYNMGLQVRNNLLQVSEINNTIVTINGGTILYPCVSTLDADNIDSNSATLHGDLTDLGGDNNCDVKFEYGTTTTYGLQTNWVTKSSTGEFNQIINNLNQETTYHYRAVAKNTAGTTYGEDKTFTTTGSTNTEPTVTTLSAGRISSNAAAVQGELTNLGGASSCNVWFEYGTTPSYGYTTTPITKTTTGKFITSIIGLTSSTTYYYRAVASNSAGTSYGTQKTFTTAGGTNTEPTVTTLSAGTIGTNAATIRGELTNMGGATSCNVWFEYGTTPSYGYTTTPTTQTTTGIFTTNINNLQSNTLYHYRAVAANNAGTVYGTDKTFTTLDEITIPNVCCLETTNIGTNSVTLSATLTDDGGEPCTLRFYIKQGTTTVADWTKPGTYNSPYTYTNTFTGLSPNTNYVAYAHVWNSQGGKTILKSFTTTGSTTTQPTVTTNTANNIGPTSATLQGTLTNMGGATSCTVYFQYGTTTNYGYTTTQITMSSTGSFSRSISGLNPGTTYYYRAVASNNAGTSYGNQYTFTTASSGSITPPTVTTLTTSSVGTNSAVVRGDLTNLGGASSCNVYFQYGTTPSYGYTTTPTTQTNTGIFTKTLTGLTSGTTYYYRAVASNSAGTSYGTQKTFTTTSIQGWTRPTGYITTTGWQNPNNARDTSTSTYSHYYKVGDYTETDTALTLTYNQPISCNQIKINARKISQLTQMTVKLYQGNTLKQTCYFTTWPDNSYAYKTFTTTQIDKIQITFTLGSGFGYGVYQPRVYDFQAYRTS